jgi:hypothetical protein
MQKNHRAVRVPSGKRRDVKRRIDNSAEAPSARASASYVAPRDLEKIAEGGYDGVGMAASAIA